MRVRQRLLSRLKGKCDLGIDRFANRAASEQVARQGEFIGPVTRQIHRLPVRRGAQVGEFGQRGLMAGGEHAADDIRCCPFMALARAPGHRDGRSLGRSGRSQDGEVGAWRRSSNALPGSVRQILEHGVSRLAMAG